jgi:hypothetical protein
VQAPPTNRHDEKVANFIDANVDKAMQASGEKLPVPDAAPLPADLNANSPTIKPVKVAVVKSSTTENHDLVSQALDNKKEDKKLMGSSAQKSESKAIPSVTGAKSDSSEFEKAFIDVDEDEEGSKPPGKEEKLQTESDEKKELSAKEKEQAKLKSSI